MRKTVHEWLETHQRGQGMAKKKLAGGKPAVPGKGEAGKVGRRRSRHRKKVKRRPK